LAEPLLVSLTLCGYKIGFNHSKMKYSSVSRSGHMVRARLEGDRVFKGKYEKLKSMIKV
jgi:hypothetical protein